MLDTFGKLIDVSVWQLKNAEGYITEADANSTLFSRTHPENMQLATYDATGKATDSSEVQAWNTFGWITDSLGILTDFNAVHPVKA